MPRLGSAGVESLGIKYSEKTRMAKTHETVNQGQERRSVRNGGAESCTACFIRKYDHGRKAAEALVILNQNSISPLLCIALCPVCIALKMLNSQQAVRVAAKKDPLFIIRLGLIKTIINPDARVRNDAIK